MSLFTMDVAELVPTHGYYSNADDVPGADNTLRTQVANFVCSTPALLDRALLVSLRVKKWRCNVSLRKRIGTTDRTYKSFTETSSSVVNLATDLPIVNTDATIYPPVNEQNLLGMFAGKGAILAWSGTSAESANLTVEVVLDTFTRYDSCADTRQFRTFIQCTLDITLNEYVGTGTPLDSRRIGMVGDDYVLLPPSPILGSDPVAYRIEFDAGTLELLSHSWRIVTSDADYDVPAIAIQTSVVNDSGDPDTIPQARVEYISAEIIPIEYWSYSGKYNTSTGELI